MNLDALRAGRLEEARVAASTAEAVAEATARRTLDAAAQTAEARLASVRAAATAEAERDSAAAMARGRRCARRIVLEARRAAYEKLISDIREGALGLRTDPAYGQLLDGLERSARRRLGEAAMVIRDPAPRGGLVAEADGRHVDYTLPVLADRCADELRSEVERLWN
jgi:vacuolar-type H+-ATPase subunit E/Vma4